MTIGILLIILVISLLSYGLVFYYEIRGGFYGREIDKAIKDMEKGITTVITDVPNGTFSVKKTKYEKKLMNEMLKNIKDIYERFDLPNRNWIMECMTDYSNGKSYEMTDPFSDRVEFKIKDGKLYVSEIIKNVSYYNGEEIVSYSDDNKHCLDELFEKGIIVGFEIACYRNEPAKIWISYKDKNYNPLLVWNIIEKI